VKAAEARAERAEHRASTEPVKPKGPKCSICKSHVGITINPWQQTASDIRRAEISDDSDQESDADDGGIRTERRERTRPKPEKRGIELKPCKHVFCGACLAQTIYQNLRVPFNPATYGTKLKSTPLAPIGGKMDFPMGCPSCQVKPGEQMVQIGDMTARLVLGNDNMDEWNHARFMSTLNIMYCPHKGCNEAFDADDIVPAAEGTSHAPSLVQCPSCRKTLCKDCKSIWHDKLTCQQYQALPLNERAPEDIAFTELAKKEKWRRCPKCSAMVELKFGCNHITCTCKHHFCYTCGADFEHKKGKYRCTSGNGCQVWDEDRLIERN